MSPPRIDQHRRSRPAAFLRRQIVQRDRRALARSRRRERHRRSLQSIGNETVPALSKHQSLLPGHRPHPPPRQEFRFPVELGLRLLPSSFAGNALHRRSGRLAQDAQSHKHPGRRQQVNANGLPAFSQPVPGSATKPDEPSPHPGLDHPDPHAARHGEQQTEPETEAPHLAGARAPAEEPGREAADQNRQQQPRIRSGIRPPRHQPDRNAKTEQHERARHA